MTGQTGDSIRDYVIQKIDHAIEEMRARMTDHRVGNIDQHREQFGQLAGLRQARELLIAAFRGPSDEEEEQDNEGT